jgi:hypothetical protein
MDIPYGMLLNILCHLVKDRHDGVAQALADKMEADGIGLVSAVANWNLLQPTRMIEDPVILDLIVEVITWLQQHPTQLEAPQPGPSKPWLQ